MASTTIALDRPAREVAAYPTFAEAARIWARIAALSFGGPAGQIAVMHRILVEEKRWIGEARFLHALNYCMLLPGPGGAAARHLHRLAAAPDQGRPGRRHPVRAAGLPRIMVLSLIYAAFGEVGIVQALFFGLKAAVLAIVLEAVMRIGKRALKNNVMVAIAAAAFVAIFVFGVPFPLIILGAGADRLSGRRAGLPAFRAGGGHGPSHGPIVADADTALGEELPPHARPGLAWSLRIAGVCLVLWLGPVLAPAADGGTGRRLQPHRACSSPRWRSSPSAAPTRCWPMSRRRPSRPMAGSRPGEMLDGLGMAETTPGPLIMVLQFVGFLGAFRDPGALPPLLAGALGGVLTTWVTFVPCFLWIFAGAPFVETLRGNRALSGGALGDHRRGRRRDPQPRALVRAPHPLRARCARSAPSAWPSTVPDPGHHQPAGPGPHPRRDPRRVPVQARHARDRSAPGRGGLVLYQLAIGGLD